MQFVRIIASVAAVTTATSATPPPPATVRSYSHTYYGTVRSDPYHWMETGGPALDSYLTSQSAYTTSLLANNPGRPKVVAAMRDAFMQASNMTSGAVRFGSRVYFLRSAPGSSDPSLQMRADDRGASRIVVDAKSLPKNTEIAWFEISPGGTKIAYGATASSEKVRVHICDLDGKNDTIEAIDAGVIPDVTWHDERSFYYSTTDETPPVRTGKSFIHTLGAAHGSDVPISGFGANGPMGSRTERAIYTTFSVRRNDAVLAMSIAGATTDLAVYVAPVANSTRANAPWRRYFAPQDEVVAAAISARYVYGLSDRGDPHRVLLIRDRKTGALVRTIRPSDSGYRTDLFANATGVYVTVRVGAESRIEHFDPLGRRVGAVKLPPANADGVLKGDPAQDAFTILTSTFRDPGHWYEVRGSQARVADLHVDLPPPANLAKVRYDNAFATSADGTKIPYTVIYESGIAKDAKRPTLVYAYGSYGYDIEPPAPPDVVGLAELGVVFVLAHVRGGGEFGEPWHLAGKGPNKQHTIDDFVACANAVIAGGWTSSAKLAGEGQSAGGITIGGAITQHPSLFQVAISQVGFTDMVDLEQMPNGPGNVPEFGSVSTPGGFRSLLAMSAYDHVVPAAYPATILTTGTSDLRTAPWQVAKMAARLQAATTSGKPVLLRADAQGHGVISDPTAQIDEYADVYTFMLWQLGEPGYQP